MERRELSPQRDPIIPLFVGFVLVSAAVFSGCSDSTLISGGDLAVEDASGSKMRHSHLFASKFVSRHHKIMERYRVLERFEGMDGVTVTRDFQYSIDGFSAHVESHPVPGFLDTAEADSDIVWIEPDVKIRTVKPTKYPGNANSRQVIPEGIVTVGADLGFAESGDGRGSPSNVDVCILDSGIVENDLRITQSWDFLLDETGVREKGSVDPCDDVGHGTHIAGTVGANDDKDGVVGVAPGVNFYSYRVLDDNGETEISTVVAAVDRLAENAATSNRPSVALIAFGAAVGTTTYNALDEAIRSSIEAGVVFVIAAGNEGVDVSTVTPAHVAEAITVGAYDSNMQYAWFSNYGSGIDLLAPAVDVVSLDTKMNNSLSVHERDVHGGPARRRSSGTLPFAEFRCNPAVRS